MLKLKNHVHINGPNRPVGMITWCR